MLPTPALDSNWSTTEPCTLRSTEPRLWRIIGGEERGGVLVRAGKELSSDKLPERLSYGAIVEDTFWWIFGRPRTPLSDQWHTTGRRWTSPMSCLWWTIQGATIYPCLARRHVWGGGERVCIIWSPPPPQEFYAAPSGIHPPTPRRKAWVVGGGGVYRTLPPQNVPPKNAKDKFLVMLGVRAGVQMSGLSARLFRESLGPTRAQVPDKSPGESSVALGSKTCPKQSRNSLWSPQKKLYCRDQNYSGSGEIFSGWRKRGVEFKGGSLHDGFGGFDGFGGSGEPLALLLLVLQSTGKRGDRDGFDGFGGYGGFGRDGYPP